MAACRCASEPTPLSPSQASYSPVTDPVQSRTGCVRRSAAPIATATASTPSPTAIARRARPRDSMAADDTGPPGRAQEGPCAAARRTRAATGLAPAPCGLGGMSLSLSSAISLGREVMPVSVQVRPGESFESLLKRFRKEVAKARILSTYRRKRWFTPPSEERRLSKKKAERRARRRRLRLTRRTK